MRRNVVLLACCQGLYLSASSVGIALSGLVGSTLAPTKILSTLPYSLIIVTTACVTLPLSFLMARIGRRAGFTLGATLGGLGGLTSAAGIFLGSFTIFCLGNALMGCFQASSQYYRFAAADAVEKDFKSKAVSWVMTGGIVAAVLGPTLTAYTKDLFSPILYAGSYIAISGLAAAAILLLSFLRISTPPASASSTKSRPLAEIARQPAFVTAVANCVIGYAVMSFIMTATPLAAVDCGYTSADAIGIIRFHLVAMFLPSLFTGNLIARYGVTSILLLGVASLSACAVILLTGVSIAHFWLGLILLGLGWNFMYVGGTTLLTSTYRPEERAKVQGFNEFFTFGATALASLAAGAVFAKLGWRFENYAILPVLFAAGLATAWYSLLTQRMRRMAA